MSFSYGKIMLLWDLRTILTVGHLVPLWNTEDNLCLTLPHSSLPYRHSLSPSLFLTQCEDQKSRVWDEDMTGPGYGWGGCVDYEGEHSWSHLEASRVGRKSMAGRMKSWRKGSPWIEELEGKDWVRKAEKSELGYQHGFCNRCFLGWGLGGKHALWYTNKHHS